MNKNDGGPAFPCVVPNKLHPDHQPGTRYSGMTLRDYFAGKALAGWGEDSHSLMVNHFGYACYPDAKAKEIASVCYAMADAMMEERGHE